MIGDYDGAPSRRSPYSPTEQYALMSLWCLLSAPLFYSGDIAHLDKLTLNVLTNAEVIDVDQDPLGKSARPSFTKPNTFVLVKELEDGSKAVGLCNKGDSDTDISASWSDLGLTGPHIVRDLWQQKNIGTFDRTISCRVPRHGVTLYRIYQQPASGKN